MNVALLLYESLIPELLHDKRSGSQVVAHRKAVLTDGSPRLQGPPGWLGNVLADTE
jgi:hypothetical protein